MNEKEILKKIIKSKESSYTILAEKMGYASTSSVTDRLNRGKSMYVDTLIKWAEMLGCELVIRDKNTAEEWIVESKE